MKAIVCTEYGSPDVLQLKEVAKPTPGDDEVLVKVHASSVNYNNLANVKGKPFAARLWSGLLKPKFKVPGGDIAGRDPVEGVDQHVLAADLATAEFGETRSYPRVRLAHMCLDEVPDHNTTSPAPAGAPVKVEPVVPVRRT